MDAGSKLLLIGLLLTNGSILQGVEAHTVIDMIQTFLTNFDQPDNCFSVNNGTLECVMEQADIGAQMAIKFDEPANKEKGGVVNITLDNIDQFVKLDGDSIFVTTIIYNHTESKDDAELYKIKADLNILGKVLQLFGSFETSNSGYDLTLKARLNEDILFTIKAACSKNFSSATLSIKNEKVTFVHVNLKGDLSPQNYFFSGSYQIISQPILQFKLSIMFSDESTITTGKISTQQGRSLVELDYSVHYKKHHYTFKTEQGVPYEESTLGWDGQFFNRKAGISFYNSTLSFTPTLTAENYMFDVRKTIWISKTSATYKLFCRHFPLCFSTLEAHAEATISKKSLSLLMVKFVMTANNRLLGSLDVSTMGSPHRVRLDIPGIFGVDIAGAYQEPNSYQFSTEDEKLSTSILWAGNNLVENNVDIKMNTLNRQLSTNLVWNGEDFADMSLLFDIQSQAGQCGFNQSTYIL